MRHRSLPIVIWMALSAAPLRAGEATVVVPDDVRKVIVRAHDSVHGDGGGAVTLTLP